MENKRYLYLNSRDEFFRIDLSKVIFFEADGNYTNIYLTNKVKGTVGMNLSKMQTLLHDNLKDAAGTFVRVGKRFIINTLFVYRINILRQNLVLSDASTFEFNLGISKDALKSLRDAFINGQISHK